MVPAFSVPEIIDRFNSISIWFGLDFKEVIKVKKSSYLFSFIPIMIGELITASIASFMALKEVRIPLLDVSKFSPGFSLLLEKASLMFFINLSRTGLFVLACKILLKLI